MQSSKLTRSGPRFLIFLPVTFFKVIRQEVMRNKMSMMVLEHYGRLQSVIRADISLAPLMHPMGILSFPSRIRPRVPFLAEEEVLRRYMVWISDKTLFLPAHNLLEVQGNSCKFAS